MFWNNAKIIFVLMQQTLIMLLENQQLLSLQMLNNFLSLFLLCVLNTGQDYQCKEQTVPCLGLGGNIIRHK